MKTTKTKFLITVTNNKTNAEYLVARVVAKGDAVNILNMLKSNCPEYLTYNLK